MSDKPDPEHKNPDTPRRFPALADGASPDQSPHDRQPYRWDDLGESIRPDRLGRLFNEDSRTAYQRGIECDLQGNLPGAIAAYRNFAQYGMVILVIFLYRGGFEKVIDPIVGVLYRSLGLPH